MAENNLNQISTDWTEVLKAQIDQSSSGTTKQSAQQHVLGRYGGAIFRYLYGATRNRDIAEELTQEFAYRFVRGDLRNVAPNAGRFRDYMKAVLRNIVNDYFRDKKKEKAVHLEMDYSFDPNSCFAQIDKEFCEAWRQEILAVTWNALRDFEDGKSNCLFTVLRCRADHPEQDSLRLAQVLSERLGRRVSPEWVRQNLRRARLKFSELLVGEVSRTLSAKATREEIDQELAELGLLSYI